MKYIVVYEVSVMVELTVELNAKLQPIHRGEMFEEPLENVLIQANVGEVLGGGTFMSATGEIEKCDINLEVKDDWIAKVFAYLQRIKIIPKGSKIICKQEITPIGQAEGMAIYLNETDLPAEVYRTNDINELISKLQDALGDKCFMFSWWEGGTETALYFYGESYLKLYESVKHILEIHPLCKLSHVKQVAQFYSICFEI